MRPRLLGLLLLQTGGKDETLAQLDSLVFMVGTDEDYSKSQSLQVGFVHSFAHYLGLSRLGCSTAPSWTR